MSRHSIVLLAVAAACGEPPRLEVPPGVDRVAVLTLDRNGAVASGTPLTNLADTPLPVVTRSDAETVIIGFGAEQLSPYGEISAAPLRAPSGCDPRLPTPRFSAAWRVDGLAPTDSPALTATWADDACATDEDFAIDVRCSESELWLRPTDVRRTGCSAKLFVERIESESGRASLCTENEILVSLDEAGSACAAIPRSCTIETFDARALAPRVSIVDRVDLSVIGARYTPRSLEDGAARSITRLHVDEGRLHDMIRLGDRALLSAPGDGEPTSRCRRLPRMDGRLFSVDLKTRETVQTSSVPPCLDHLWAETDGFLATFLRDRRWWIGRFRPDGTETQAMPLEPALGVVEFDLLDLHVDAPTITLIATTTRIPETPQRTLRFDVRHDDLTTVRTSTLAEGAAVTVARRDDGAYLGLFADPERAKWFDDERSWMFSTECDRAVHLLSAVFTEDQMVLLGQGKTPVVHVDGDGTYVRRTSYEAAYGYSGAVPWPNDSSALMLFGFTDDTFVPTALVSRYEPGQRRLAPGTVELGHGVATASFVDDDEYTWVLLPWAPSIVLLDLAR